jgi:predicted phage baseplate assembly protein
VYILRIAEDGTASITFGDGERGLRPPTGQDNVTAVYRKGAGSKGMLEAGQLSLLASKPVGLKSVSNPLPPAAAADAETLEDARRNAPLRVLTLGRVVSLRDYEDYARAFAGIAKARADWTFDGAARPIFVTVAGEGGVQLPEGGEDIANLLAALQAAGEADLTVSVRNFKPASFVVEARLFIDPAYGSEDVLEAGRDALEAAFSFDARELGQGVSRAQVIAVLQDVKGVIGVDVNWFHRTGAEQTLEDRLGSARPQPSLDGTVPAAAELLTIDIASTKLEAVE